MDGAEQAQPVSSTARATTGEGSRDLVARIPGTFSLVLPSYNEEANIEIVVRDSLAKLPKYADTFEIIVVNDGSRDTTGQIIDRLQHEDSRVRSVHHVVNRGYGGALASGFKASTGEYVMFMDADRQFDIDDLSLLSPFVRDFDIVAGFRKERNDPAHRRLFAEIFNVAVRVLFGVHLRDIDCAFKVFRGDLLRSIRLTSSGALINTEIQAKLRRRGARLQQVGVNHYPRVAGTPTGGNFRVILRAMGETLTLFYQMHSYQPESGEHRRNVIGVLGDAVIGVTLFGAKGIASVIRRLSSS